MSDFTDKIFEDEMSQHQKDRNAARKEALEKKREEVKKREESRAKRAVVAKKTIIIAAIGLVVMLALFGRLVWQISQLSKQRDEALKNLNDLNEKIEQLESTLDRVTSLDYIEEQARSQLRMIYPGEKLYIVDEQ